MTNVHHINGDMPPGATTGPGGGWTDKSGLQRERVINAAERPVTGRPDVRVLAAAIQHRNGTISEPTVTVAGADSGLTTAQARQLAALILDAADELDRWQ